MQVVARASLRHLLRHRWQLILSLLGIALGVAVVVAVDLANESARRAFRLSLDSLTGEATHQIKASAAAIDESVYTRLRLDGWRNTAPVVEGYIQAGDETLHLVGLDVFAESSVRDDPLLGFEGEAPARLLSEPDTIVLAATTAQRLQLAPGDRIDIEAGGRARQLTVIGLLQIDGQRAAALDGLAIADIASAQEILDRTGQLDRIDLVLEDPARIQALRERLPAGLQLLPADSRGNASEQMTRAFSTNLQAMSLLALVVGMFLIYNSMTFSVLRRRELFATLRALGVTRAEMFRQILYEAASFGAAGAAVGLLLGTALAQVLLGLVTRTINDLYFVLNVTSLLITPGPLLKGLALGVGAALIASLLPALEAARTEPRLAQQRSLLESRSHHALPWLAAAGLIAGLGALGLLALPDRSLLLGFSALFLIILGASLWTPLAVVGLARLAGAAFARLFGHVGRMAARSVEATLSRTGIAIAALAVAVSATVGVGVMVGSFRITVQHWLGQTLQADIYVAAPHGVSSRVDGGLPEGTGARIAGIEGIAHLSHGRRLQLTTARGPLEMLVLAPAPPSRDGFHWREGEADAAWQAFSEQQAVLVSEPFAYHNRVGVGDELRLPTDAGEQPFRIAGVFTDYGSDRGMIVMHRDTYERWWQDRGISTYGLFLQPHADRERVMQQLRERLSDGGPVLIRSSAAIREGSMAVFDRTFAITNVLRLLAVGVAFVGILSALLALQMERARELAILRATGYTPGQVWALVGLQTGFMGLCAALLAVPLGLVMSEVLIDVINRRSFGWSMELSVPLGVIAEALWLALGAALLAGLYPAWRMGSIQPALALREE